MCFHDIFILNLRKTKAKETTVKHLKKVLKDGKPEVLEMDFGSEFVSLLLKKTGKMKICRAKMPIKG